MKFNERYERYMPFLFYYAFTAKYDKIRFITDKIKEYYFGNNNIGFMTAFQLRDVSKGLSYLNCCHQILLPLLLKILLR